VTELFSAYASTLLTIDAP